MRSSRVRSVSRALGIATLLTGGSAAAQPRGLPPAAPARPLPPPPGAEVVDLLRIEPGGLTAEQVATRAVQTSFVVRSAEANERAATARVDHYSAFYIPTLTLTARYTRFSTFTPPAGALPPVLDNSFLDAYLTVPLSDY